MSEADEMDSRVPPGAFVKLYATILRSSVWSEAHGTRLLWITMLADADAEGYVRGSVGGLARLANISREEAVEGLRVLSSPDPDSRTEEHEGRRVEEVAPGTWKVLNFRQYREMRTPKQLADADRQRRHRAGVTGRDTSHVSQPVTPRSPSTSPSLSSVPEDQEQENSTRREGEPRPADPLDAVLVEARFPMTEFSEDDEKLIRAFLRSQRSALAVALVLRAHLMDEEVPPKALAWAITEYMGKRGTEVFESRYFAGFVKRARGHVEQKPMRVAARQEERFITSEDTERERERREELATDEMLREFERAHGDTYTAYAEQAEASVDPKWKGMIRAPMVRAKLTQLVRSHMEKTDATR